MASHSGLMSSECSNFSPPATVILLIFLCFEGLLFLIFTAVMFGTQVHSICNDETVSDLLLTFHLLCHALCHVMGIREMLRCFITGSY